VLELTEEINLNKQQKHDIDVIVDRLIIKKGIEERLADSVATALREGNGIVLAQVLDGKELLFSEHAACVKCGISFEPLEPTCSLSTARAVRVLHARDLGTQWNLILT